MQLRKYRGRLPADLDVAQLVRESRESRRSRVADQSARQAAGAVCKDKGGILKALRGAPRAVSPRASRAAKHRYITAADVLADLPPPETARKLRVVDVHNQARRRTVALKASVANWDRSADDHGSFVDSLSYSDHLFKDLLTVIAHGIAARKLLNDPSLIVRARRVLGRWISKQRPVPRPFIEWRRILAGTPQQIAAVALSLTEEATRLRSSSPLSCLLNKSERAAVYGIFSDGPNTKALGTFLDEWEQTYGAFTPGELAKAEKELATEEDTKLKSWKASQATSSTRKTSRRETFARVLAHAIRTFGSRDAAEKWLSSPQMTLEMKRPMDLLRTNKGAELVETVLGRIYYGVCL